MYGDALVGTISSDNTAWIFGEKCYCLGAEKVSQVSKIRGASIKYCYGDEVADWSQEVFELLKSRLDKAYSCFDGTYNPQGPNHWLKAFLDSKADVFSQTYTIDDNPFLPEAFVENLKREYRGTVFYDRYILGRWALAEGLIYPMFGESNIVDEEPPAGRYYISVDYGTLNPFSAGLWCVTKQGAVRIKEYYYSGRGTQKQLTDEEYYQAIRELADGYNVDYVVIDPSAASFITTVFRHNEFHVVKANNDVMDGIRRTSVYLKSGELKIHRQCKDAIREFGLYRWDEESTVDKVIKADDHAMDDIRYFANTILVRYFPVMR